MRTSFRNRKKNKTQDKIQLGRSLIPTGAIILLVVAASLCLINYISHREEERSFERLYAEADNLAANIELYAENDREELEMISAVIAQYDDMSSPELWRLLDSYTNTGMMSRIELLLPGDIVLTEGGKQVDAKGVLSFEAEVAKNVHITDRETDIIHKSSHVVRHYVPVIQNGETIAMLYGVIMLGELPEDINLNPYDGKGALYIIDGNTGDFLIDTWHPGAAGNIWSLGEREMAPGYNSEQLRQGVSRGESRYVVFVSKTVGEYLYFYYQPMAINDWRIAVSVPESVVFESANTTKRALNIFLVLELMCFIIYFLWMMRYVHNVTGEKQKRLDMLRHIYEVEQLLFNAHEKKENAFAALEKLGGIISAEKVSLWFPEADGKSSWYLWEAGKPAEEHREANGPEYTRNLSELFASGNETYESYDENDFRTIFPGEKFPGISNVIAVPVEGADGHNFGILAACNVKNGHEQAALLKNMQFSFGMFCNNLKTYTEIQEQGEHDALTGLYNRNRYERDLPQIYARHKNSLSCVYIDVNGLHETNNTEGHDKGDDMLRTVAEGIKKYFNTEYIYRTGGDEFVLFIPSADKASLEMRGKKLASDLSDVNYYISVGISCGNNLSSLFPLIKEAEQKMYAEKRSYYEKHDRRRTPRT